MPWTERYSWEESVLPLLPGRVRAALQALPSQVKDRLQEIRLRAGRPVEIQYGERRGFLGDGTLHQRSEAETLTVSAQMCQAVFHAVVEHSPYAKEGEIRQGYVTLRGGCRVGFTGQVLLRDEKVRAMPHCTSICFRVLREIPNAAQTALPHVVVPGGRIRHCLVLSPPGLGKTTLLRDLARRLGDMGRRIVVIDERSEIAGCWQGVPTVDVGQTTDVLDGCPKDIGIMMALRSMAPEAIVTDEIGSAADVGALTEAARSGVAILASAHGRCEEDVWARPMLRPLMEWGIFERILLLEDKNGSRTVRSLVPSVDAARRVRTCGGC